MGYDIGMYAYISRYDLKGNKTLWNEWLKGTNSEIIETLIFGMYNNFQDNSDHFEKKVLVWSSSLK